MAKVVEGKFRGKDSGGKKWVELCDSMCAAMNMEDHPFVFSWPHKFRVIEPDRGAKVIVDVLPGDVLQVVPLEEVVNRLVVWARLQLVPEWLLDDDKAKRVAKTWRAIAEAIQSEEIAFVRWSDEPGYTWNRLPWTRDVEGTMCTWDKILERMSNNKAFVDWIGSLFYEKSDIQQYCFIHGKGADGKGAMNRFLAHVFGGTYASKQPYTTGDKFWTYGLLGKRLVVFPDLENTKFLGSGLYKSLTGGDPVAAEIKGGMAFTIKPNAKYLVLSNHRPDMSGEESNLRRIVYCEMEEREDKTPEQDFEDKLWNEGGVFLRKCLESYITRYPGLGPVKTETSEIADHVTTLEFQFSSVFEEYFVLTDDKLEWLTGDQLWGTLCVAYPRSVLDRRGFIQWLERRHRIRRQSVYLGPGDSPKRYKGLGPRLASKMIHTADVR